MSVGKMKRRTRYFSGGVFLFIYLFLRSFCVAVCAVTLCLCGNQINMCSSPESRCMHGAES